MICYLRILVLEETDEVVSRGRLEIDLLLIR